METVVTLMRTLLAQWKILVLMPFIAALVSWFLTQDSPKKYRTESKLFLNIQESKGISLSDDDLKQYQVHTYFQNVIELLRSEKTVDLVKSKAILKALESDNFFARNPFGLDTNKELIRKRTEKWINENVTLQSGEYPDSLILNFLHRHGLNNSTIRGAIVSFRLMDSHFMKLEITGDQAEKTQLICSLLIEGLQEQNTRLAKEKIKSHKDIIEKLVEQAKHDLEFKIKRLENYKVSNNIINLGEHTKAIVVYLVQLEGQRAQLLQKIAAGQKGREEVLSSIQNGNEVSLDLTGHHEILALRDKLQSYNNRIIGTALESQQEIPFDKLTQHIELTKGEIHSKLQELARKTPVDPSQIQIDLAGKFIVFDLEAEISKQVLTIVDQEILRVNGYARKFAPHESTIGANEQDISTAQNVYLTLLNKLNITESLEYGSGENVIEVIDAPFLPAKPEPGKRIFLILGSGIGVFILVTAVLIILKLTDKTISNVSRLERKTKFPIAAALAQTSSQLNYIPESLDQINNLQLNKVCQSIISKSGDKKSIIILSSTQRVGILKSTALHLYKQLNRTGLKTTLVYADWTDPDPIPAESIDLTPLLQQNGMLANQKAILEKMEEAQSSNDLTLLVIAPINSSGETNFWSSIPGHWMLVYDASRIFTDVCGRSESSLAANNLLSVESVLANVHPEELEEYIGEIPKRRSFIRKAIKKLLTRS